MSSEGGNGQWVRSQEGYWFALFGDPRSKDSPWGYRFGGHHIGLTVNKKKRILYLCILYFLELILQNLLKEKKRF
ncbi:MAG: hypothetical protein Ct9H90mP2_02360 [Dehalococcoidia bacterium]|nr:MAG: hypothetical protein Ct9H90mP2_02360 [Dehalococcoidia bacterium]